MDTIYAAGTDLLDVAEFLNSFQEKLSLVEAELRVRSEEMTEVELEILEENVVRIGLTLEERPY